MIKTEHFFTTRESIIKTKEPDYTQTVEKNKYSICDYLNIKYENLISPSQTHTSNIQLAKSEQKIYPETDGLITNTTDIAIFLNFADCTPVIFYDETENIGAIAHAGWRGTAANIAGKTVQKMISDFSSKPENITAAIGPAIGFCCYNVGEEVYEKLKATVNDFNGLSEIRNGEIFVDLKRINARQLEECGIKNIDIAPYCTCCNNDLFFSYRKENATTNRHSAVLKITKRGSE
ncbi:peptidoglycan editing factor PgeF [bacterium]|nr:peptidoglycan editing factor PgeF [bacterium]